MNLLAREPTQFDAAAATQMERIISDLGRMYQERNEALEEVARAHHEALFRLAIAAEYQDDDTGKHIVRLGFLRSALAQFLGQSKNYALLLRKAAPMHDIGKIGIPDSVLKKPGSFTPDERLIMYRHPAIGASILGQSRTALFQMAAEIALTHHERWDGKGCPNQPPGRHRHPAVRPHRDHHGLLRRPDHGPRHGPAHVVCRPGRHGTGGCMTRPSRTRWIAWVLTCGLPGPGAVAGEAQDRVKTRGELRVCIWPGYQRISFHDPRTGQLSGLDIAMLPPRMEQLQFAALYMQSDIHAVTTRSSRIARQWSGMDQPGVLVGVQAGKRELMAGRVDVFMTDDPYGRALAENTGWATLLTSPVRFHVLPYAHASKPGDAERNATLNALVARIRQDGRLDAAARRHGLESIVLR